jgi:hypothetical protein
MKAKLIKTIDGYELFTQGFLKGSTNHGLIESLNIEEGPIRYKLSLKNCQAIELGYDLDELAKKEYLDGYDTTEMCRAAFKDGFQKALELMGDRNFSEQDVLKVVTHVLNELVLVDGFNKQYLFPESIYQETTTKCKSLQPTQWDVEIVEECLDKNCNGINKKGECITTGKPKLDSNNCLILKKL